MKKVFTLTLCWLIAATYSFSQVRSNYEYSTTMPYGTLDIRTHISSSDYYYLQQNDVVYVEPNNAQKQGAAYNRNASVYISIASVLISLMILITK